MKHRVLAGVLLGAALVLPATAASAEAVPKPLTGTAVYGGYVNGYQISQHDPAKGWKTLGASKSAAQFAASPDGRKVAWVTIGGKLQVRENGRLRTVATGLQGGTPCLTPVWSADSTRLAYAKDETVTIVKADGGGATRAGATKGVCHLAWSADGRYIAGYTGEANGVYRLDVKTGRAVKAKGIKLATHVQSLSPDGRNAVVEFPANPDTLGDGSWPTAFKPVVVDLVTGRKLPVAVKGTLIGALYLPDGRLVVRVQGPAHHTLVVLDRAGKEVQRVEEDAKAKTLGLLQVVG